MCAKFGCAGEECWQKARHCADATGVLSPLTSLPLLKLLLLSTSLDIAEHITRLSRLTRLVLWEYQAPTLPLLGALAGLPRLAHLSLFSLDDYYLRWGCGMRAHD